VVATGDGGAVLDRLTIETIQVAGDPFGKFDDRIKAIHRLGQLGTDRAYDFLADNLAVGMSRPVIGFRTEDAPDLWEELPYYMALTHVYVRALKRLKDIFAALPAIDPNAG